MDGGIFEDGRHGYTTGRHKLVQNGSEVIATGAYVTMWRRDDAGMWRVILDGGAPDP